jgi:ABC-type protease/lipase transport system fused ATPase/permease subunit
MPFSLELRKHGQPRHLRLRQLNANVIFHAQWRGFIVVIFLFHSSFCFIAVFVLCLLLLSVLASGQQKATHCRVRFLHSDALVF